MTAQISDNYFYEGKEYSIVAMSNAIGFKPEDYGLVPHMSSTGCWRGYWCDYKIENDCIALEALYLFNRDGNYPTFYGKDVSPEEYETCLAMQMGKNGEWVESYIDYPKYNGHRVYENLNMKLPYTGKLLLGAGFIHDYYIHMGYQRSWAYEELIELAFDNGLLVKCTDHSDIAKKQREYIDTMNIDSIFPDEREMEKFVTNSFSLDYKNKVWWLT